MRRTEAWKLQHKISKHCWGLILKYSHCTLPSFLVSLSSSKNPRARSGLCAEGRFGHLQMGSTITTVLSRELHTEHTAVHNWTTRKCLKGHLNAILPCSDLRVLQGATSTEEPQGPVLYFFQEPSKAHSLLANHSQRSITSFYSIVPGKEQSHKKQKPQEQLPSLHRRKSNSNLCCPAGTSQAQGLLLETFPPPLGTAPQYCSKINWAMQEASQFC